MTFAQFTADYYEQAKALIEGGADILLVETCHGYPQHQGRAASPSSASRRELGTPIPVMVSGTIETMGTMLAGQTADALCASIATHDLLSIGLNCATGPEFMTDHLRTLSEMAPFRVSCYPNAGPARRRRQVSSRLPNPSPRSSNASSARLAEHGGRMLRHHRAHIRAIAADGRRASRRDGCRNPPRTALITPASNWSKPKRAAAR